MERKVPSCEIGRILWDGPTETLVQSLNYSVFSCGMSHSGMVASRAVSCQPELRVRKKNWAPCSESSTFLQELCQQPHGRWFIDPWAWEARSPATRDVKDLFGLPLPESKVKFPSEIWWKQGVWATKGGWRLQKDNLKPEKGECGEVWSQGSDSQVHCLSDGGRKGKQRSVRWFLWQEREHPKLEPSGNQLRKLGLYLLNHWKNKDTGKRGSR